MSQEKDPGALAGALGAGQDAAGQQPGPFTKCETAAPLTTEAVPTRKLFDEQPLAQFAGHVVLAWRPATSGDRLGFAKVRLPNVADTDLVVSLHCGSGGRLWAEAAPDTPRRCQRRLESALSLLCNLIAPALGSEAIGRMLRQRDSGGAT
jgi:hypothetical protein